jgi:hypothetical protein
MRIELNKFQTYCYILNNFQYNQVKTKDVIRNVGHADIKFECSEQQEGQELPGSPRHRGNKEGPQNAEGRKEALALLRRLPWKIFEEDTSLSSLPGLLLRFKPFTFFICDGCFCASLSHPAILLSAESIHDGRG